MSRTMPQKGAKDKMIELLEENNRFLKQMVEGMNREIVSLRAQQGMIVQHLGALALSWPTPGTPTITPTNAELASAAMIEDVVFSRQENGSLTLETRVREPVVATADFSDYKIEEVSDDYGAAGDPDDANAHEWPEQPTG